MFYSKLKKKERKNEIPIPPAIKFSRFSQPPTIPQPLSIRDLRVCTYNKTS